MSSPIKLISSAISNEKIKKNTKQKKSKLFIKIVESEILKPISDHLNLIPIFYFSLFFFLSVSNFSCKQVPKVNGLQYSDTIISPAIPVYFFAIHPLNNSIKLMEMYQPLIDYLNSQINGAQFELEASLNYSAFEQKIRNRKPEFILPNPYQTLLAINSGYNVIAMAGDPKDFKGLFIVRKDAGINQPSDLIGKEVSYASPTAFSSCIMTQYFLYKHGININKDIKNVFTGTSESAIMNAYLKETSAATTWPQPWRIFIKDHPAKASKLKVIWETESLINNSVMVRNDIPVDIIVQVKKCLSELHESVKGKTILKGMETEGFYNASNKTYDVVKTYTHRFEKEVRKIDTP
ncbi:MAG: PhnD/SsuA/transferrin family substrate-binding protein [Bacteroidota bacterium]|nr:PhnD/SsuA/transferrin family substrate-binding protein [Bacteroidota bacterium]